MFLEDKLVVFDLQGLADPNGAIDRFNFILACGFGWFAQGDSDEVGVEVEAAQSQQDGTDPDLPSLDAFELAFNELTGGQQHARLT